MSQVQLLGLTPGRDFTPNAELDTDTILRHVGELEREPSMAKKIRMLLEIEKGVDEYSVQQLRREYGVKPVQTLINELQQLLTASRPNVQEMLALLRRNFANRSVAEMQFFAEEYSVTATPSTRSVGAAMGSPLGRRASIHDDLDGFFTRAHGYLQEQPVQDRLKDYQPTFLLDRLQDESLLLFHGFDADSTLPRNHTGNRGTNARSFGDRQYRRRPRAARSPFYARTKSG